MDGALSLRIPEIKNPKKKADSKTALNIDLWQRLMVQLERHDVSFR